jgi:hypothetical protein
VSPSSRTPTLGADQAVSGAVGYGPQAAHINEVPTPDKAAAAPKAPKVDVGDGSLGPVPDMTAAVGMTTVAPIDSSISASSP